MKALPRLLLVVLALTALGAGASHAAVPLNSGFTYQGQLNQSGSPVSGTVHFRFSLWDAASGGAQLGASQVVSNVLVTGGIFTVTLNAADEFSATPFDSEARWLQIEVCTDAGCSSTTVLTPRQPLTPSPFAFAAKLSQTVIHHDGGMGVRINPGSVTNTAGMLSGTSVSDLVLGSFLDGGVAHGFISCGYTSNTRKVSIGRASSSDPATKIFEPQLTVVSNTGNVGIGNASPEYPLSFNSNAGDKIGLTAGANHFGLGVQSNLMQIHTANNLSSIGFGYGSSGAFTENMRIEGGGDVGIGTNSPNAKLDVRGDVRMGSTGQYLATGGPENLKIIRGSINGCGTGTIVTGGGFTLTPGCTDNYRTITFTTPFSNIPVVTANATDPGGSPVPARICEILLVTTSLVRIRDYNRTDGNYAGGPIQFIAIGPR